MNKIRKLSFLLIPFLLMGLLILPGCGSANEVVVYTSVDRNFAEPILKEFERSTGIKIKPVYDVEASKTTGLVNKLIEEKSRPRADVFWNGEIAQTIRLKDEGVLDVYASGNAKDLPENFIDPDGMWTAFGGRARVFIVNTDLVNESDYPDSIMDLLDPGYEPAQIGIALPLFGTTATQAAALYAYLGEEEGRKYFKDLNDRKISVLDGNSVVRDYVADGRLAFGLTDTDDALGALEKGKPVSIIFPDQKDGQFGTLVIPNSVALVKGGPNKENGRKLIDYLLEEDTMKEMIESGWCQVTVRNIDARSSVEAKGIITMDVSWLEIFEQMERVNEDMKEIFNK